MKKKLLVLSVTLAFAMVAKAQFPTSVSQFNQESGSSLYPAGSGVAYGSFPYAFCASEPTDHNAFECAVQPAQNVFAITSPSAMGHLTDMDFSPPPDPALLIYSQDGSNALVMYNDGTNSHIGNINGGSVVLEAPSSLVLKSGGGSCYLLGVTDGGLLTTNSTSCP